MNESDFICSLTVEQRKTYNALKVLRNQRVTTELDKALERLSRIITIRDKKDSNYFSSEEPLLTDTIIYISNALYHSNN
jgi:hypothetical protein